MNENTNIDLITPVSPQESPLTPISKSEPELNQIITPSVDVVTATPVQETPITVKTPVLETQNVTFAESTPKVEPVTQTELLTETQQQNKEIMISLQDKYPNAFKKGTDSKGREYLLVKEHGMKRESSIGYFNLLKQYENQTEIVVSQEGVTEIQYKSTQSFDRLLQTKDFDLSPIIDDTVTKNIPTEGKSITLSNSNGEQCELLLTSTKDFRDEKLDTLKKIFTSAESKNQPVVKIPTSDIVASL